MAMRGIAPDFGNLLNQNRFVFQQPVNTQIETIRNQRNQVSHGLSRQNMIGITNKICLFLKLSKLRCALVFFCRSSRKFASFPGIPFRQVQHPYQQNDWLNSIPLIQASAFSEYFVISGPWTNRLARCLLCLPC